MKATAASFCYVVAVCIVATLGINDEKRLIKRLMDSYEENVGQIGRPVYNLSDPLTIQFGMSLQQIDEFDETLHVLTTNVWLFYNWKDELLQWKQEDYGGIRSIRLPTDRIWIPDIQLYNSAGSNFIHKTDVVVSNTGHVTWVPPATMKSVCSTDLTNFPFDTQLCPLKFGSWTYDGGSIKLELNSDKIDISTYIESHEFKLTDSSAKKSVVKYDCCPETYEDITFVIGLRRSTKTYVASLLASCVILSWLILVIFWMPPDSVHKITIGFFILFGFMFLQPTLGHQPFSSLPWICVFIFINMLLVAIAIVLSAVIINISRSRCQCPCFTAKITSWLSYFTCAEIIRGDVDGAELELIGAGENATPEASKEMRKPQQRDGLLLGMALDRILFIVYFVVILITCICALPRPQ